MDITNEDRVIVYQNISVVYEGLWENASEEIKNATGDWFLLSENGCWDVLMIISQELGAKWQKLFAPFLLYSFQLPTTTILEQMYVCVEIMERKFLKETSLTFAILYLGQEKGKQMQTHKYYVEADGDSFEFDSFEKCIFEASRMIKCDLDVLYIEHVIYDENGNIVQSNIITN